MLPKIDLPIVEITIPSLGTRMKFRPYLVREEKLLLMGKQGGELDHLLSIKQVVVNCCLEENFQIDRLSVFDLEWVFIKLRSISVSSMVEQEYDDSEDELTYKINVDLDQVLMPDCTGIDRDIVLPNDAGTLRMRFPSASLYGSKSTDDDVLFACAEMIYKVDAVTPIDNREEFLEWYDTLPVSVSSQVQKFFTLIPTMSLDLKYTNSRGSERTIKLRTLSDFFDLR